MEVVAKTAKLTPGLRHAFNVLNAWRVAQAKDSIPWHNIKNGTPYTPPTLLPAPPPVPTTMVPESQVEARSIGPAAPSTLPTGAPVESGVQDDAMEIDDQEVMRQDKGKGRQTDGEGMNSLTAPEGKRRKISPKIVPAHHLTTEGESGESTPPPPKPKKDKSALARMTPSGAVVPPDLLWKTREDRPAPRCENCTAKGHPVCRTTAMQLTCTACHAGKTKCSYSAARTARREAMVSAGELPGKKGSGRKKVQVDEGSEVKQKGGKAAAKRKRQSETADEESGIDNTGLGSATQPYVLDIDAAPTPGPSSLPATGSTDTRVAPAPRVGRAPTLGGLQRELTDVRTLVAALTENLAAMTETQNSLMSEVTMLRGWVEVLMTLKEDMLVKVPELTAELRGLRNGMDLERVKAVIATLQTEVETTKAQLAQAPRQLVEAPRAVPADSSSSDDNSSGDSSDGDSSSDEEEAPEAEAPEDDPAATSINLPMSSMFVHPSQLRDSRRRVTAAVHRALGAEDGTTGTPAASPMDVAVPAITPIRPPPPGVVNVPTAPSHTAAPPPDITGA